MCTKRHRQSGLTIIELIAFVVIVAVALVGVLTVLNVTVKGSSDPVLRKQGLAVAEAILEEVQSQPFTWCDPDDLNAPIAMSYSACTSSENHVTTGINLTYEAGESRGGTVPFDNVSDYNGLSTSANIAGGGSAPYAASVAVIPAQLNGVGDAASASSAAVLITVTVVAGNDTIQLQGYRTRYAPNATP
jgi:MSHA pilin protein MshD